MVWWKYNFQTPVSGNDLHRGYSLIKVQGMQPVRESGREIAGTSGAVRVHVPDSAESLGRRQTNLHH
jgi:hypothetical protein